MTKALSTTFDLVNTALYQQLGEKGNEMENEEFRKKKWDELQSRLSEARGSIHHIELVKTKWSLFCELLQ